MNRQRKTAFLQGGIAIVLAALLLCNPKLSAEGFLDGIQLCVKTVLPALFPFFVLCEMMMNVPLPGRFLRYLQNAWGFCSEKSVFAVLVSWIGGYAVCAQLTGNLYCEGKISRRDALLITMLGCCSSPGFVIGCVGGLLLQSVRLGVLLYGLQIVANLLSTALCVPFLSPVKGDKQPRENLSGFSRNAGLSLAIENAVNSSLNVCGCVLFFRTVGAVLRPILPETSWSAATLSMLLEISAGCADFSALGGRVALYGCCLCLSVWGCSVWAQLSLLLRKSVPLPVLALQRIFFMIIFIFLVAAAVRFLPGTLTVYSSLTGRVVQSSRLPADAAVVVFLFVCATLYKVRQNFYNK